MLCFHTSWKLVFFFPNNHFIIVCLQGCFRESSTIVTRRSGQKHFEGVAEHALYVYSKIYAISNHSEKRFCDASCMHTMFGRSNRNLAGNYFVFRRGIVAQHVWKIDIRKSRIWFQRMAVSGWNSLGQPPNISKYNIISIVIHDQTHTVSRQRDTHTPTDHQLESVLTCMSPITRMTCMTVWPWFANQPGFAAHASLQSIDSKAQCSFKMLNGVHDAKQPKDPNRYQQQFEICWVYLDIIWCPFIALWPGD